MDGGQALRWFDLLVRLIQTLVWPGMVLFVVLYFGGTLRKLLSEVREGSFKATAAGVEGTFKREFEVAAALGLAEGKRQAPPSAWV